jgi:excinuclease ABC subunit B
LAEDPFVFRLFSKDYLMVVDESHVTLSQVHAMYGGDRSRKENLVEYSSDSRQQRIIVPKFEEFEAMQNQVIYVSATQLIMNFKKTEGVVVEQVIRPTGYYPVIEIRPSLNQIDDLIEEIQVRYD